MASNSSKKGKVKELIACVLGILACSILLDNIRTLCLLFYIAEIWHGATRGGGSSNSLRKFV